jgi:hypothetical protein
MNLPLVVAGEVAGAVVAAGPLCSCIVCAIAPDTIKALTAVEIKSFFNIACSTS